MKMLKLFKPHLLNKFHQRTLFAASSFSRDSKTGICGISQLTKPSGFAEITKSAIESSSVIVDEIYRLNGRIAVIDKFDDLSNVLCRVADLAEFIRFVHPQADFAKSANDSCMEISSLVEELNTDVKLYQSLANVMENSRAKLSVEGRQVGELLMRDFQKSGIHLSGEDRAEVVRLSNLINDIGNNFVVGTSLPIAVPSKLVPPQLHCFFQACEDKKDHFKFTHPYYDFANGAVRRSGYLVYMHEVNSQSLLLEAMLRHRRQLAEITGYDNYVSKALVDMVLNEPSEVIGFIDKINSLLMPLSAVELSEMQGLKRTYEPAEEKEIRPWDIHYYSSLAKRTTVDENEYMDYFSLTTTLTAIKRIFFNIFSVSLTFVEAERGELWSQDVQKIAVHDANGKLLGYIYCDFFVRAGKPTHDCHFTIQGGKLLADGSYQHPIIAVMCSLSPGTRRVPTLLTFTQMRNLFHEMGHAIHSMLARTQYQHVTGTRCSTDFAEVPSNLMEFYCYDKRILSTLFTHYRTGEKMPDDLCSRLLHSQKMFAAVDLQQQVQLSALDYTLHSSDGRMNSTKINSLGMKNYLGIETEIGTAPQLRFSHLFGYGAKYYSYLWSRAVASRIWHHCFKDDPLSSAGGQLYYESVLRHGGAKSPSIMLREILNEELDLDSLAESLVHSLHS